MILSTVALLAELESESRLEVGLRPRLKVSLNPDRLHIEEESSVPATDMVWGSMFSSLALVAVAGSHVGCRWAGTAGHEAGCDIMERHFVVCRLCLTLHRGIECKGEGVRRLIALYLFTRYPDSRPSC